MTRGPTKIKDGKATKRGAKPELRTPTHGGQMVRAGNLVVGDVVVLFHLPRPIADLREYTTKAELAKVRLWATGREYTLDADELIERTGHRWEVTA